MGKKAALLAGIGRLGVPVAENLAGKGWKVAASFRKGRESEKTVKALSRKLGSDTVLGIESAITEPGAADDFVSSALEQFGRIDALICIASGYPDEKKDWLRWENGEGLLEKDWLFYSSNFLTARNTALSLLPRTNNPAGDLNIIFFSDSRSLLYMNQNILDPYADSGGIARASMEIIRKLGPERMRNSAPPREINPYTLAKIDLVHLAWGLAAEYQGGRVRFNVIAPGPMLPPPGKSPSEAATVVEETLLKRWGETAPVVKAVDYLLANSFVTGEILRVDGGFSLYHRFIRNQPGRKHE